MYQSKDVLKDSFKVKQLDTPPPKKQPIKKNQINPTLNRNKPGLLRMKVKSMLVVVFVYKKAQTTVLVNITSFNLLITAYPQ